MAGTADLGILIKIAEENTQALKRIEGELNQMGSASDRASSAANNHSVSFLKLTGAVAAGNAIFAAAKAAISGIADALTSAAGSTIGLSSNLEQARIGFTSMLGSVEKADAYLSELQDYAESTAFTFPSITQAAQRFIGMGFALDKVLPTITDISNALAGTGSAGNIQALDRVTLAFAQIQAKGKLTGEEIHQLADNNIPVLAVLTEGLHKSAAEIMQMASNNEIASETFFKLFHDYTALHFGDIQAQQAQTWAVASSNLGDVLGRLAVTMGQELFAGITQAALALNDFLHEDRVRQWAADFNASIRTILQSLAPLWDMLRQIMGLGAAQGPVFGPSPAEVQRAQAVASATQATVAASRDYKAEMAAIDTEIHGIQVQQTGIAAAQAALKERTDAVKESYKAQLEPLKAQQQAIQRMAEDTKAMYDGAIKPLEEKLKAVKDTAEDIKTSYDKQITSLKDQVTQIQRANDAIQKQYDLENRITDLELRRRLIAAQGDPNLRAALSARMQRLQDDRDNISTQVQLLQLSDKHGSNKKAIAALQKQADALEKLELQARQKLYEMVDHAQVEQITKERSILEAKKAEQAIVKETAAIEAEQAKQPLIDKQAELELQRQKELTPLIQKQRDLEKEIAGIKQQAETAAAGFAKQQQGIARAIQDIEAAEKRALAPLEAQSKEYDRQNTALGLQVKNLENTKKAISDAEKEAKKLADTVAKIGGDDGEKGAAGGKKDNKDGAGGGKKGPTGQSFFSPETAKNIRDAVQATINFAKEVNAFFKNLQKNESFVAFVKLQQDCWKLFFDLVGLVGDILGLLPKLWKQMDGGGDPLAAFLGWLDKIVNSFDQLVKWIREGIEALPGLIEKLGKAKDDLGKFIEKMGEVAQNGITGALETITGKIQSVGDAFRDAVQKVQDFVSALRGISVPNITLPNISIPGLGRAAGGPVTAGMTYLVGEEGPELFTASASGQILSNSATQSAMRGNGGSTLAGSGGGGINVYVTVNGTIVGQRELDQSISDSIGRSVRNGRYLFGGVGL